MPTPKKGARLGGSPAHQRAILANLATSLFEHGAITTTEAKARMLRPYAERLITKAKRGDLHNRRQVASVIRDKTVVHVLFTELGPKFAERPGGYTRITKLGPRKGDNAPMAVIALVDEEFSSTARTRGNNRPAAAGAAPAVATDSDEATSDEAAPEESTSEETTSEETTSEDTTSAETAGAEAELSDEQDAVAEQEPAGETVESSDTDEVAEDDKK